MKWIEVIQLRCCGDTSTNYTQVEGELPSLSFALVKGRKNLDVTQKIRTLTEGLLSFLLSEDGGSWLREVKIFHNAAIATDVCLHLHWEKPLFPNQGSTVGFCIADALKEFGLVDHSVWVEDPG